MQHRRSVFIAKTGQFICLLLLTTLPLLNFKNGTVYILLGVIAGAAFIGEEYINWISKTSYKSALNILRDALFKNMPPDEMFHHRATLFKANRRETKLKFFCRSGTQYQRNVQSFQINNDNEMQNEGIAGQAWFKDTTLNYSDLPKISSQWRDDDDTCKEYAKAGHLPLGKAKRLNVKSRSIAATPIRNLDGKRWGVLVVDSRNPDDFLDNSKNKELFESIAANIEKLL
ncbi:MAG: GAF domain-containing protein [Nitrospinae bacterium]|nr:GAF domain-containing protein [Nitrospinota bacterium]